MVNMTALASDMCCVRSDGEMLPSLINSDQRAYSYIIQCVNLPSYLGNNYYVHYSYPQHGPFCYTVFAHFSFYSSRGCSSEAQGHPSLCFFLIFFLIFLYLLIHLFWFVLFKYTLFNISTKFYHVNVPDLVIQANFQLQPSISMSKWWLSINRTLSKFRDWRVKNMLCEPTTRKPYNKPHGGWQDEALMAKQGTPSEETWPVVQKGAV